MIKGDMKQYIAEEYRGDIIYKSLLPRIKLSAMTSNAYWATVDVSLKEFLEVGRAFLEVGVRSLREKFLWRLKLDGVPISREFKPNSSINLKGTYYSKAVYDVTPILKRYKRTDRLGIMVKYVDSDHIYLEHLGLLLFVPSQDVSSYISFLSGTIGFEPSSEYEVSLNYPGNSARELHLITYMPSPYSKFHVTFNDEDIGVIGGYSGTEEHALKISNVRRENKLKLIYAGTSTTTSINEAVLFTVLMKHALFKEPRLVLKEVIEPQVIGERKMRLVIANEGLSKPDAALLTLIYLGTPIYRTEVPELKPGEEVLFEVPLNLSKGTYQLVVRLVWRKATKTSFNEERITISL
ncbi:MAG: hypothetical protein QXN38_00855 [Desulfurococcaceae archaeon]